MLELRARSRGGDQDCWNGIPGRLLLPSLLGISPRHQGVVAEAAGPQCRHLEVYENWRTLQLFLCPQSSGSTQLYFLWHLGAWRSSQELHWGLAALTGRKVRSDRDQGVPTVIWEGPTVKLVLKRPA